MGRPGGDVRAAHQGLRSVAAGRGERYEWLGKALAVLTDGQFACARLDGEPRRWCEVGAAAIEEPLVTFS